ncbi:hypothetical protein SCG7109_AI_00170 [Chlamydiales bacterium SCGC AG-110-M15]|nr:hypothetical protein SCG7109_AI_00170 [Chlamydiales bacterium SCGC AG-110-M15]
MSSINRSDVVSPSLDQVAAGFESIGTKLSDGKCNKNEIREMNLLSDRTHNLMVDLIAKRPFNKTASESEEKSINKIVQCEEKIDGLIKLIIKEKRPSWSTIIIGFVLGVLPALAFGSARAWQNYKISKLNKLKDKAMLLRQAIQPGLKNSQQSQ